MDQGHHSWSPATLPPSFFWLDELRGSFLVTFTISTFYRSTSKCLKVISGGGVVAHVILVSAQVLTLGLWTLGLETLA